VDPQLNRRNTRQRRIILDELRRLKTHPTAAVLYQIVRRRLPRISLGTVYRNLELLAGCDTIRKLDLGSGEARFDGDVSEHNHVRCVGCGAVQDVAGPALDLTDQFPNDWGGYHILGHRLEFLGLCPECQKEEASAEANGVSEALTSAEDVCADAATDRDRGRAFNKPR
jgi:Fur family transcriptional regulator, ferric uptake regulator